MNKKTDVFKSIERNTIRYTVLVILCLIVYGFICPFLVSHKSDELSLAGSALMIIFSIAVFFYLLRQIRNYIESKSKEGEEK